MRGRPVIATDVGSASEVLGKAGGGVVVGRADTASLAEAMLRYARDPELVTRHGEQAQQLWEQHFTPEAMLERHVSFWQSLGIELES